MYFVIFHTGHFAIEYSMDKFITNDRVTRWLLLLQNFDVTTIDKLGKDNVVADFLSMVTTNGNSMQVEDTFPNECLFTIFTKTLWFVDIASYLVAGKLPFTIVTKGETKSDQIE